MADPAEARRVAAARSGDERQFRDLTEPHRRELMVHCYRLLGSFADAEDAVQETFLRAWRRLETFDGRGPFRAWLYRIATHAAIDAIDRRPRRVLPVGAGPPGAPGAAPAPPPGDVEWIGPLPDQLLPEPAAAGEEAVYSARESVALAFVAALQHLPARQRAVLLLRDVLGWRADEVATLLDFSVPAVNSALQRARATLADRRGAPAAVPDDAARRDLLGRYVRAWHEGDVPGLVALLKEDATLSMPPNPLWLRGREAIAGFLRTTVLAAPGAHARLVPAGANGQPAFGFYGPRPEGGYALFGVHVLALDGAAIAEATTFLAPALARPFGLHAVLTD